MFEICLVDPRVSRKKFDQEVKELLAHKMDLRKRGWIVESIEFPIIRVTFLATNLMPPVVPLTIEIDFKNYNYLPPSVRFLHPVTLEKNYYINGYQLTDDGPRGVVVLGHPETKLPFLCLPGVQEYHSHPEHSGDSWDLYRYTGEGKLYFLLHYIWLYCIKSINAFRVVLQLNMPTVGLAQGG